METTLGLPRTSSTQRWAGRILTGLAATFMIMDGVMKLLVIAPVVDAQTHLGFPVELSAAIGALELVCLALHLFPQTSVLGAVLLTGFLGGATAIHVRIGDPFYFPVLMGILLWAGLHLRDERARALFPVRRN